MELYGIVFLVSIAIAEVISPSMIKVEMVYRKVVNSAPMVQSKKLICFTDYALDIHT